MGLLANPWLRLPALAALLAIFDRWVHATGTLGPTAYHDPWLGGHLWTEAPVLTVGGLLAVAAWRHPGLRAGWSDLDAWGRSLRLPVTLAVVALAWKYSTYSWNPYLGQTHAVDRWLLVALAMAASLRPILLLPFALQATALAGQFDVPLGNFLWTIPASLVRVVVAGWVVWMTRPIPGARTGPEFLFLAGCVLAAGYWWPGLGKLRMGWLDRAQVQLTLLGGYSQGWLSHLEPSTIATWLRRLEPFQVPMRLATAALELGAILLFVHRRVTIPILGGWIAFHAIVFVMMGFAFWEWVLLEVALLAILLRDRGPWVAFGWPERVVSVVLLALLPWWLPPHSRLAWFDTRYAVSFRYEAIHAEGGSPWPASHFAPYTEAMTMGSLGSLRRTPVLTGPYGVTTNRTIAAALDAARSPDDLAAIRELARAEGEWGRHDPEFAARFDDFVRTFVRNADARGPDRGWWSRLAPPPTLLATVPGPQHDGGVPVDTLAVDQVRWFYDGQTCRLLGRDPVRRIAIR